MAEVLVKDELEAAHCWEADDRMPGRPAVTEFRRRLRYHQSRWREAHGHPIGSQPIAPKSDDGAVRLVGSRLPLAYARETGANFLTVGAFDAAKARSSAKEPHQMLDAQRLWADLLSSTTLCFNLFGDLAADPGLADQAVHTWWPDAPGQGVRRPLRALPGPPRSCLHRKRQFVVCGVPARPRRWNARDHRARRHIPRADQTAGTQPSRLAGYVEVTERSGVFKPGAIDAVNGTDLLEMWLEHLLLRPVGDPAMFVRAAIALLEVDGDDALAAEAHVAADGMLQALPDPKLRATFASAESVRRLLRATAP